MNGTFCTASVPLPADGSKVSHLNVLLFNESGTMVMFHMHVSLAKHFYQKTFRHHFSFSANNIVEILTKE
jgi:hypothetical protein